MSRRRRSGIALYLEESRRIGPSLAMVVPLLLAYEVAMLLLQAPLRNGAEMVVSNLFRQVSPEALVILRRTLLGVLIGATIIWLRRDRPRVARPHWVLMEALGLALVLGPLVGWMVGHIGLSAAAPVATGTVPVWLPFLLSVGAGLWEEIVFRLGLLGGMAYLLLRITPLTRTGALSVAVVFSALAFGFYHHVGELGEPFIASRFAFRCVAGTILGVLFTLRGLAVVVYMHVFYDLLCDLRAVLG